MHSARRQDLIFRSLSLVCGLIAVLALSLSLKSGLRIDTDLKSLSPTIVEDPKLRAALDSLSSLAERKIVLLLQSQDYDVAEEAGDFARELLKINSSDNNAFALLDYTPLAQEYMQLIYQYRFNLISDADQQVLSKASNDEILAEAQRRLFSMSSSARIFSFEQDPLSTLNGFALEALQNFSMGSSEDVIEVDGPDGELFYVPLVFELQNSALDMESQEQVLAQLEGLEADLHAEFSDLDILRSGVFFFSYDAATNAKRDVTLISSGSIIGSVLLLLFIFRSLNPLLLPVLSIGLGAFFAFSICHFLFSSIHVLTIVFGASLIGVVIDYSLHYFYARIEAGENESNHLIRALGLSLLTSIIGYGALSVSGLVALKQIALFSMLGLAYGWLMVVTLGPLLANNKITIHDRYLAGIVSLLVAGFSRLSGRLYFSVFACIAFVFALFFYRGIQSDDSLRAFFSPNAELIEQELRVNRVVSSFEPASYLVISGSNSEEIYHAIDQVRSFEQFSGLLGVDNFIPPPEKQQKSRVLSERLYGEKGVGLEFVAKHSSDSGVEEKLAQEFVNGKSQTLDPSTFFSASNDLPPFWFRTDSQIYSFMMIPRGSDISALKQFAQGQANTQFLSTVEEAAVAIKALRKSASAMLAAAFLLIACVLLFRFRSLLKLLLLTVPLASIASTVILLNLFGIPLTLFHTMSMFLVLGLGMDYVIFVTEMSSSDGIDLTPTVCAVMLSALTSLLSFGLLSLSSLPVVSAFGMTVLIGNGINLLGSIILASLISKKTIRSHN